MMKGLSWLALMSVAALTATTEPATALTWSWSYSGDGITADGTFTTVDAPDASGFYLITGIAGVRNGAAILGLQPTGTPIPGNEPFAVDNLVRLESPQLTTHGFGYAVEGGTFSNPFFASFLQPPEYLEFFSAPPFTPGISSPEDSELPIRFSATPVPEADTWLLLVAGLGMLGLAARGRGQRRPEMRGPPALLAPLCESETPRPRALGFWPAPRAGDVRGRPGGHGDEGGGGLGRQGALVASRPGRDVDYAPLQLDHPGPPHCRPRPGLGPTVMANERWPHTPKRKI